MSIVRRFQVAPSLVRLIRKERGGARVVEGYFPPQAGRTSFVRIDGQDCHLVLVTTDAQGRASEERTEVPRAHGDALLDVCAGKAIYERTTLPLGGGRDAVLDRYVTPAGLDLASVAFDDEAAAKSFVAPVWFGADVSSDAGYERHAVAIKGVPASGETTLSNAALDAVLDLVEPRFGFGNALRRPPAEPAPAPVPEKSAAPAAAAKPPEAPKESPKESPKPAATPSAAPPQAAAAPPKLPEAPPSPAPAAAVKPPEPPKAAPAEAPKPAPAPPAAVAPPKPPEPAAPPPAAPPPEAPKPMPPAPPPPAAAAPPKPPEAAPAPPPVAPPPLAPPPAPVAVAPPESPKEAPKEAPKPAAPAPAAVVPPAPPEAAPTPAATAKPPEPAVGEKDDSRIDDVIESLSQALSAAIQQPREPARDDDIGASFERWTVRPRRTNQQN